MKISNWLDKAFPLRNIPNIGRFYLLTILNNTWFLAGNWIFYWLRFMTYGQLGIMDATCFAFGLFMEVPSGAIADIIGKRKSVILAMFLNSAAFFVMGSANNLGQLWIGFLMAQAGWAFYSGAAEALAYDTLVDLHKEDEFEKVMSTSSGCANIAVVVATFLGGIMYVINYRSTHLAMGLGYLIAGVIALKLVEPVADTEKFSFKIWWLALIDGSKQLLVPSVKPFVIVMLVLMGAEGIYEWGLLKPAIATSFGFFDKEQAVIYGTFGIISAIVIRFLPNLRRKINDKLGLYLLTIFMGIGFLLASLPLNTFGLLPIFIIMMSGYLVTPWISVVVNKEIDAKHRATALSTVALITKIPYVLVAMLAGSMVEKGQLWLFNLGLGLIIVMSIIINLAVGKIKVVK